MSRPHPSEPTSAGYSQTPLPKKLGIKPGASVVTLHAPKDFAQTLGALPKGATLHTSLRSQRVDLIIAFVTERRYLSENIDRLVAKLPADGALWVGWPKKASKMTTDLSDQVIRDVILPIGWVDTKVCAIDSTWSGLKFVLRLQLRP